MKTEGPFCNLLKTQRQRVSLPVLPPAPVTSTVRGDASVAMALIERPRRDPLVKLTHRFLRKLGELGGVERKEMLRELLVEKKRSTPICLYIMHREKLRN